MSVSADFQSLRLQKVVLSTVHSAKGLEWPVVFIPAVENGSFPFYLASKEEEIDEERSVDGLLDRSSR